MRTTERPPWWDRQSAHRESRNYFFFAPVSVYGTEFEARAGRSGHVAHVLWAGSDEEGYFGVWEVTSSDAHFELRRGGPCRLVPLTGDAPQWPSVRQLPPIARDGRFVR